MSGVLAKILANQGPPLTFRDGEKTYALRWIDWDMKIELAQKLYERKRDILATLRGSMPPDRYEAKLDKLAQDFDDGVFDLEMPEGRKFYATLQGRLVMGGLIFGCDTNEMLLLLRRRGPEVGALMKQVVRQSVLIADDAGGDSPNPSPPETASPG
jgi:hypothetical protein